jgi:Secretion system C-terminal sorting domain
MRPLISLIVVLCINFLTADVFEQTYNFDQYFLSQTGNYVSVHEIEPRCLQITPDGGFAVLMELELDVLTVLYYGVALMKADQYGELEWIKLLSYDPDLTMFDIALANIKFGRGFEINNVGEFVIPVTSNIGEIHGSFLINLNSDGEYNWVRTIRDDITVIKLDFLSSIKQTNNGDYFAVGKLHSGAYDFMEVVKFNAQGDTLWTRTYVDDNAIESQAYDLEIMDDGNPIITGSFDIPLNPTVFKIDNLGEILWRTQLNSTFSTNQLISISEFSTESNYFVGYKDSNFLRIDKIDSNGEIINNYDFLKANNNYMYPISVIPTADNIIFAGRTDGDYDINCCDYNGDYIWQFERKWYGKGVDVIKRTNDNNFSVVSVQGLDNLVLTKFDSDGNYTSIDENIMDETIIHLNNYPNPFTNNSLISFKLPLSITNTYLEIYNIKGEKILNLKCQNQVPISWDGTDHNQNKVSSGIYFYRIVSNGRTYGTNKMVYLKN